MMFTFNYYIVSVTDTDNDNFIMKFYTKEDIENYARNRYIKEVNIVQAYEGLTMEELDELRKIGKR